MSIESIVNQSLDLIGYKRHIGSIWEGTPAARLALDAYAETRDEVFAASPWQFARAYLPLTADATPPPPPWLYTWSWPNEAITILDVYPAILTPEGILDPEPSRWLEDATPNRIILTRFSPAATMVTRRVLDPAHWTPEFTSTVIRGLAEKLQRGLTGAAPKEQQDEPRGHRQ